MDFSYCDINSLNLNDSFFDSLRADYAEFQDWITRKARAGEKAYVSLDEDGNIDGFLYLKIEDSPLIDVTPPLPPAHRLKIGTFKIDPRGTRLGERFIKKALDHAFYEKTSEVYVTVFSKHDYLINLLQRYGFTDTAEKNTPNGTEQVLLKKIGVMRGNVRLDYPCVNRQSRKFLLSLYPQWHTRLLPDSILNNENPEEIVTDVSHTNSIHKIYLTKMEGTGSLRNGDTLVIYRTSDGQGPAHYRSVATSICVVEEVRNINEFATIDDFLAYASSYSIFDEKELRTFFSRKNYPIIIKFTYNSALIKRVNRAYMLENLGMNPTQYWGFFQLSDAEFNGIVDKGGVHEGLIIN